MSDTPFECRPPERSARGAPSYYAGYKCPSYHGTLDGLNTEGDIMFHINGQVFSPGLRHY